MDTAAEARHLYLDLLKKVLTNWIYQDSDAKTVSSQGLIKKSLNSALASRNLKLLRTTPFDPQVRTEGRDWPQQAHTMIGLKRLENLQSCVEDVLAHQVPGDLIEAGAWRGGASILMRAVLKAYGVTDRVVWVADSFAGLPPPDARSYPLDQGDRHHTRPELAVSLEQVQENFKRYGLLDDQVRFLKGWFRDTLPHVPAQQFAVVRLDGDMYESTLDGLVNLYPKLSPGGFLIVDDYGNETIPGCRQAVQDYRKTEGISEEIHAVDWTGAYWQKA